MLWAGLPTGSPVEDWPGYGAKGPGHPKYCSEVLNCEGAMRSKNVKIVKQL